MKVKRLPYGVFNRAITFVYGTTDEASRYIARRCPGFTPLRRSCMGHWTVYVSQRGFEADFIFIRREGRKITQLGYLAHEALHCASHALRMAGLEHTEATEEAYTYYQEWIIRECAEVMR